MRNFLSSKLWPDHRTQWILHFSLYLLVLWLIHLIMISIIAFFHFQLDYSLSNIEDWVSYNAWEILVLTKLSAFWFYFRFLTIRVESRFPVRLMLQHGFSPLKFENLIPLLFILLFIFAVGLPEASDAILVSWLKVLWSYLGVVIFYGVDIFIFIALQDVYPLGKRDRRYLDIICALLLTIASYGIFPYVSGARVVLFLTLYLTSFFTHYLNHGKNWTLPVFYLFIVAAPLASFFGVDTVWAGRFAPLKMTHEIGIIESMVLIVALTFFKRFKETNKL